MIKLSQIIILNVPKREREGKYLKKLIETSTKPYGIPVSISMDRGKGLWDNYSQALTQDVAEGTHRMIIHDDITFDRNILKKILFILANAPENNVISFYNPTNGDYMDCFAKEKHVISTRSNFWLQACVYPNNFGKEFVEVSNSMTDDPVFYDDSRMRAFLQYKDTCLYAIVPGLVQHFGAYRSTFGNPGKVGKYKRYSSTYDNQFDVGKVNWKEEFENPYLAKSSKDFVKEIVNKEFLDEYKKL